MIAKICRYAAENGNKTIITKFTGDLGFEFYETTVRSFKRAYYEQLQSVIDPDAITSLKEQISCSFMSLPVVHQSCKALDKSINDPYKMELKQCFIDWCVSDVKKVLD